MNNNKFIVEYEESVYCRGVRLLASLISDQWTEHFLQLQVGLSKLNASDIAGHEQHTVHVADLISHDLNVLKPSPDGIKRMHAPTEESKIVLHCLDAMDRAGSNRYFAKLIFEKAQSVHDSKRIAAIEGCGLLFGKCIERPVFLSCESPSEGKLYDRVSRMDVIMECIKDCVVSGNMAELSELIHKVMHTKTKENHR